MSEKIIEKLAKIKAHADSAKEIGNEAEAAAFAGMLQQLLLKHKLELSDIDYKKEMESEPIVTVWPETMRSGPGARGYKRVFKDAPDVEVKGRRVDWVETLASFIAQYHSCRILVAQSTSNVCFVGHKSNVAIAEFLFIKMVRIADKLSAKAAQKFRREYRARMGGPGFTPGGFRESFLHGFIERIASRLREEQDRYSGSSTALVRVRTEAKEVNEWMNREFKDSMEAKSIQKEISWNGKGYAAGIDLANSLDLNTKAVREGMPNAQLDD